MLPAKLEHEWRPASRKAGKALIARERTGPGMRPLASEFFKSDLSVWFTGAALLFGGPFIIAFHPLISVFGWILGLRGSRIVRASRYTV